MANDCLCHCDSRNGLLFHRHDYWWLNFASGTCGAETKPYKIEQIEMPTVASLILHHMVFSFGHIFCNEAFSKKGVFWHGVKQIWETKRHQLPWKVLCWKNHQILPKKGKPLFFKLLSKQVKPLWKSKKCYRQASINLNIDFTRVFVVLI